MDDPLKGLRKIHPVLTVDKSEVRVIPPSVIFELLKSRYPYMMDCTLIRQKR